MDIKLWYCYFCYEYVLLDEHTVVTKAVNAMIDLDDGEVLLLLLFANLDF